MIPYPKLLSILYSVNKTQGMKLGLENVSKLHQCLGCPAYQFPVVHVAGTNGKGSVTAKIAKGLQSKFARVGLFTSPHISTFRERITINQELIPKTYVEKLMPLILNMANKNAIAATFFELTTLLAFTYFSEKKVDIAVIETGLGGRLDATNIVRPKLAVITSIQRDHEKILGSTLESIAFEKGGIIKESPVILGPTAKIVPLKPDTPCFFVDGHFADVEMENRAIAKCALKYLGVNDAAIKKALTTKLPCRRERIFFAGHEILLDVAHNPSGLDRLFCELGILKEKLRVIAAISKTKDIEGCLKIINKYAKNIHFVDAPNGRCCSPAYLKNLAIKLGKSADLVSAHKKISEGIRKAFALCCNETILITGSFFIMSETRKFLGFDEPCDLIDL